MNEFQSYEQMLNNMSPKQWSAFLLEHAYVLGDEINIELAETFSKVGTLMDFKRFVCIDRVKVPKRSPEVFLTYCGVLGYGVYLSKYYDQGLLNQLRECVNDPRATIQKGVFKALRYIGHKNFRRLITYSAEWKDGTPLEQRACLAAIFSTKFSKTPQAMLETLELLEWSTSTFVEDLDWSQDYKLLQEEVAWCWARVIVENPVTGKKKMERWMKEQHPMIKTIMKKSLQTNLLQVLEYEWANKWLGKVRKTN